VATKQTPAPYLTARQQAALQVASAMVGATGYEILDQGDGEIAANIAKRSVEIVDAVLKVAA
jgi:hypothetical protein